MRTNLPYLLPRLSFASLVLAGAACTGGGLVGDNNVDGGSSGTGTGSATLIVLPARDGGHGATLSGSGTGTSTGTATATETDTGTATGTGTGTGTETGTSTGTATGTTTETTTSTAGSSDAGAACSSLHTEGSQGTVLASAQPSSISGFALDSANVYWSTYPTDGVVAAVPKIGGSVVTLATGQARASDVVSVGGSVYWPVFDTAASIMRAPSGGGVTPTAVWTDTSMSEFIPHGPAGSLSTDGTNLFFALAYQGIESLKLSTGDATLVSASTLGLAFEAVVGSELYVLVPYMQEGASPSGTEEIEEQAASGGSLSTLYTAPVSAPGIVSSSMTADATGVYWIDAPTGNVMGIPTGGTAKVLGSSISPGSLAVDGTNVYWSDGAAGTIQQVAIGGGPATMIVSDEYGAGRVQVDATNVYWANNCFGTIKKIAK